MHWPPGPLRRKSGASWTDFGHGGRGHGVASCSGARRARSRNRSPMMGTAAASLPSGFARRSAAPRARAPVLAHRRQLGERADAPLRLPARQQGEQQVRGRACILQRAVRRLGAGARAGPRATASELPPGPGSPRASPSVSMTGLQSGGSPRRGAAREERQVERRVVEDERPGRRSARAQLGGDRARAAGAPATIASVMPWTRATSAGIGRPGRTRLDQVSATIPSSRVTVATSTSAWPCAGLQPVVSVSTTTSRWPLEQRPGRLRAGGLGGGGVACANSSKVTPAVEVPVADVAQQQQEAIGRRRSRARSTRCPPSERRKTVVG